MKWKSDQLWRQSHTRKLFKSILDWRHPNLSISQMSENRRTLRSLWSRMKEGAVSKLNYASFRYRSPHVPHLPHLWKCNNWNCKEMKLAHPEIGLKSMTDVLWRIELWFVQPRPLSWHLLLVSSELWFFGRQKAREEINVKDRDKSST